MANHYRKEEPVVYCVTKHSKNPGRRARQVTANKHGERYSYCVKKYWLVDDVLSDGNIRVRTRRGKFRTVSVNDKNLRPASWWERIILAGRFPKKSSNQ